MTADGSQSLFSLTCPSLYCGSPSWATAKAGTVVEDHACTHNFACQVLAYAKQILNMYTLLICIVMYLL